MSEENEKDNVDNTEKKLNMSDVMCCFNKMTIDKLKNKLSRSWIEETTNSGQIYRQHFTKKQIEKIMKIVCNNT